MTDSISISLKFRIAIYLETTEFIRKCVLRCIYPTRRHLAVTTSNIKIPKQKPSFSFIPIQIAGRDKPATFNRIRQYGVGGGTHGAGRG